MHIPSSFPEELIGYDMAKKAAQEAFSQAGEEVYPQPLQFVTSFVNHDTSNDAVSTTGVTPRDVDVVELHDCFSTNELITYEALVSHPALIIACPPLL